MNELVNMFLLARDKTRQSGFSNSASGLFTKNKERIQKFNKKGGSQYIY